MGLAILEQFETLKEAWDNIDRVAKKHDFDKDRLYIIKEYPEQWDGNKKFSICVD